MIPAVHLLSNCKEYQAPLQILAQCFDLGESYPEHLNVT